MLWTDPAIQEAFSHNDETTIPDPMDCFFGRIKQISEDGYRPNDEDILRARIRTVGINSIIFNAGGLLVRVDNVSGQKNERSKWAKVSEEVQGVVFCVSFADFDKRMFESCRSASPGSTMPLTYSPISSTGRSSGRRPSPSSQILVFPDRLTGRWRVVRKCAIKCVRGFENDIASGSGADAW
jgi:hypothetical protein